MKTNIILCIHSYVKLYIQMKYSTIYVFKFTCKCYVTYCFELPRIYNIIIIPYTYIYLYGYNKKQFTYVYTYYI